MSSSTIGAIAGPKARERPPGAPHVIDAANRAPLELRADVGDQVGHHRVDHANHRLVAHDSRLGPRTRVVRGGGRLAEQARTIEIVHREHIGLQPVVDVVREVGDLVGEIDDLRLQARKQRRVELRRRRAQLELGVLDDSLADLEGQVEPAEIRITHFDPVDRTQALRVVIETAVGLHQRAQRPFAGMAERRVSEIVRQRDRLGQFRVEPERARHRARDLRGLHRMRQARAVVVALVVDEDLGLVFEAAKGGGMHDTVAVALERRAHRMRRLGETPSAAHPRQHRVRRERARLQFLEIFPVS